VLEASEPEVRVASRDARARGERNCARCELVTHVLCVQRFKRTNGARVGLRRVEICGALARCAGGASRVRASVQSALMRQLRACCGRAKFDGCASAHFGRRKAVPVHLFDRRAQGDSSILELKLQK